MTDDIRWCPICGGYKEAGGDSTCTCNQDDDGDYGDWLYEQMKDKELDEMLSSCHAHELINH